MFGCVFSLIGRWLLILTYMTGTMLVLLVMLATSRSKRLLRSTVFQRVLEALLGMIILGITMQMRRETVLRTRMLRMMRVRL